MKNQEKTIMTTGERIQLIKKNYKIKGKSSYDRLYKVCEVLMEMNEVLNEFNKDERITKLEAENKELKKRNKKQEKALVNDIEIYNQINKDWKDKCNKLEKQLAEQKEINEEAIKENRNLEERLTKMSQSQDRFMCLDDAVANEKDLEAAIDRINELEEQVKRFQSIRKMFKMLDDMLGEVE